MTTSRSEMIIPSWKNIIISVPCKNQVNTFLPEKDIGSSFFLSSNDERENYQYWNSNIPNHLVSFTGIVGQDGRKGGSACSIMSTYNYPGQNRHEISQRHDTILKPFKALTDGCSVRIDVAEDAVGGAYPGDSE